MEKEITPGKAAKIWASQNKEFKGKLRIRSTTRKGKGGWGTTGRRNDFLIRDGLAAIEKAKRYHAGDLTYYSNGMCSLCLSICFETELCMAHGKDPLSGEPLSVEDREEIIKEITRYSEAITKKDRVDFLHSATPIYYWHNYYVPNVCKACMQKHNLLEGSGGIPGNGLFLATGWNEYSPRLWQIYARKMPGAQQSYMIGKIHGWLEIHIDEIIKNYCHEKRNDEH